MALVQAKSASHRRRTIPEQGLEDSIREFRSILTDEQRATLQKVKAKPDFDAVIVFTAQLDQSSRSRRGRSIASRLHSILQSIREFSSIVETFVSSHPEIAALVWGSVKLTMLVAINFTSYFEPLSNLFMGFNKHCPRFSEYQSLYPGSVRLQAALCDFHAAIIRCCKHAVEVVQRSWHQNLLNALWRSFDAEFKDQADAIQRCGVEVKEEIVLAKAQADHREQALQQKERQLSFKAREMLERFMSSTQDGMSAFKARQLQSDLRRTRERRQLLLERLSRHDFLSPFKQACKKRHSSTGEWITSTSQFVRWTESSEPSLIWCFGKIGSGKTILTASAIEHIFAKKRGADEFVTFFFLQFDDPQSLKAETILRSIIRQSLDPLTLSDEMEASLQELDQKLCPSLEDLAACLCNAIASTKSFYLFVDALDECEQGERRALLDALLSTRRASPGLKMYISSRESLSIEIGDRFQPMERISMACTAAYADIGRYVDEVLQQRVQNQDLVVGDALYYEVRRALVQHADGMFLWVTYLIDDLCAQCCDADIRESLRNLPKDLEEAFNRVLSRIVSRNKASIAQKIFPWVVVAKRNLTLAELREAISLEVGQPCLQPEKLIQGIERVVAWSENLLHVDEELKTVQFAHRTICDFIVTGRLSSQLVGFHVDLEQADHFAGELCVTYLHLNDFKTSLSRRQQLVPLEPGAIARAALENRSELAPSVLRF
ncbi:hypothetical protein CDD83_8195 [Cordyceps sp. RAO-2017]|nr:hypothetical protein CDD83_8195 [Cordyceps sp. RAO-2017]